MGTQRAIMMRTFLLLLLTLAALGSAEDAVDAPSYQDLKAQLAASQAQVANLKATLRNSKSLGSALAAPSNTAKCNTAKDDQTKVMGKMSCGGIADGCPDNLSKGCFM